MNFLKLTDQKLSVDEISKLVDDCGVVSLFVETIKENCNGKKITGIEFQACEPLAMKAMESICELVRKKFFTVANIGIFHRLDTVPSQEASIVVAISGPIRKLSLDAVSYCVDRFKDSVPIWQKPIYKRDDVPLAVLDPIDKNLVQINALNCELEQRIENFIERKREQVNLYNIQDFMPTKDEIIETESDSCARVRMQLVKRKGSKGHLKISKVHNEWGPQTVPVSQLNKVVEDISSLPSSIAERVLNIESYLHIKPVSSDIYKRLKIMEDKIEHLKSVSPEYAQFWTICKREIKEEKQLQYSCKYTAEDISKKIKLLEKQAKLKCTLMLDKPSKLKCSATKKGKKTKKI